MTSTAGASSGDKITLAVVVERLDVQKKTLSEILEAVKDIGKEQHRLDTEQCVQSLKISTIEEDIDKNIKPEIKTEKRLTAAGTMMAAASTALLGWLGLQR